MLANRLLRLFGILVVAALVGCGTSETGKTFKVTPVSGKVTMANQPLADAQVTLVYQGTPPKDYPGSGAKTDAQGNFEILTGIQKGVMAGKYLVLVSKMVGADGKPFVDDPNSGMDQGMMMAEGKVKDLIPPAFSDAGQATQTVTVTDGTPIKDLVITIP